MNKAKRVARKRAYQQIFNNTEVANQLADIRNIHVLTLKDREGGVNPKPLQRIASLRIFSQTQRDSSLALTYAELQRRARFQSLEQNKK